jgi:hypothetical protein
MTTPRSLHEALAAAVVARSFELSFSDDGRREPTIRLDDALAASPSVETVVAQVGRPWGLESWKTVITRLAISLARDVAKLWSDAYPDRAAPLRAVEAAETWAACPCDAHAEVAASVSSEAARQAMAVWRLEPKAAAWAGAPLLGSPMRPSTAGRQLPQLAERVVPRAWRTLLLPRNASSQWSYETDEHSLRACPRHARAAEQAGGAGGLGSLAPLGSPARSTPAIRSTA